MTAPNPQQADPEPHAGPAQGADTPPNEGESAQDPAEGADDVDPPTAGSPRG